MAIESEDALKMKLDDIRLTCDNIETTMQEAGATFSHLDKAKCMRLARSIKQMALEVNNYFEFLEE
jgi:hypothetical protein